MSTDVSASFKARPNALPGCQRYLLVKTADLFTTQKPFGHRKSNCVDP